MNATDADTPGAIPDEDWSGRLLAGRYRLVRRLGTGGMGMVYEACDEQLGGRRVAVKALHPHLVGSAGQLARFEREATSAAALGHANIVQVIDFVHGGGASGEPALLVMEFLAGSSLSGVIAREGPLPEARVAFVARQVLAALGAAHAAHIVHRDLKPDNVFLTSVAGVRDVVKLLDFGVAKLVDDAASGPTGDRARLTATGAVLGTPAYMAPEQARGRSVDHRADLYAVGVLMYEALTGRLPFVAANYNALLFAILEDSAPALASLRPDVSPALAAAVARAMARDPAARFQTADAMRDAIEPFAHATLDAGPPAAAPPVVAPAELGSAPTLATAPTPAPTPAGAATPPATRADTAATGPAWNPAPLPPVAQPAPPTPLAIAYSHQPPTPPPPAAARIHPLAAVVATVLVLIAGSVIQHWLRSAFKYHERLSAGAEHSHPSSIAQNERVFRSRESLGRGIVAFADAAGIPLPIAPPPVANPPPASPPAPVVLAETPPSPPRAVRRHARWTGGAHNNVLPEWPASSYAQVALLDPCVSRSDYVPSTRGGFTADLELDADGHATGGTMIDQPAPQPDGVLHCFDAAFRRMEFGPTRAGHGGTIRVDWRVSP